MTTKLTIRQLGGFRRDGLIALRGALSKSVAKAWVEQACARHGIDRTDPRSWKHEKALLPWSRSEEMSQIAPRAWDAVCELLGGEERLAAGSDSLSDAFIVNLCVGRGKPWESPSSEEGFGLMWHKDGIQDRHYLGDPLCALLVFVLWSDVEPRGGGTFVALDSIAPVACALQSSTQGLDADSLQKIGRACRRHAELTGKAGDVFLLHPFMLHTESRNHSGRPRFMTNKLIALKKPMDFKRRKAADFSPVEASILNALRGQKAIL